MTTKPEEKKIVIEKNIRKATWKSENFEEQV